VNANRYRPTHARALILSPDPLVGALLGAAAELSGYEPVYPTEEEAPRDTLRETRPEHLLLDCEHPAAADETLLGNAMMIGARISLFGTDIGIAALAPMVERYQLRAVVLPREVARLPEILATAASESIPRPPQSTAR
jgi:hypothetical protein